MYNDSWNSATIVKDRDILALTAIHFVETTMLVTTAVDQGTLLQLVALIQVGLANTGRRETIRNRLQVRVSR